MLSESVLGKPRNDMSGPREGIGCRSKMTKQLVSQLERLQSQKEAKQDED